VSVIDESTETPELEVLSDGTRLDILRELIERLKERPVEPTLEFADLRRRVGVRDSGNFNYHLDKLVGRFVLRTDEGYRITPAGVQVVAALVSGIYGAGQTRGPERLDRQCPICGEALTATYEHGVLEVGCANEHAFSDTLPPGALEGRDLPEIVDLLSLSAKQDVELAVDGTCPSCFAPLDWAIEPDERPGPTVFRNQCARCGTMLNVLPIVALLSRPRVAAFFERHDVDVRRHPLWASEFHENVTVETSTDPVRVHVTIELEGDALEATLDEELSPTAIDC
jgi:DNA-binding transcriptional ArsR family regulator